MRNSKLKEVRGLWRHSRFFYGKNRVMQAALGRTEAEEYREGLSHVAKVGGAEVGEAEVGACPVGSASCTQLVASSGCLLASQPASQPGGLLLPLTTLGSILLASQPGGLLLPLTTLGSILLASQPGGLSLTTSGSILLASQPGGLLLPLTHYIR